MLGRCKCLLDQRGRSAAIIEGASDGLERFEHDIEAGALAGVVNPRHAAGELAYSGRESYLPPAARPRDERAGIEAIGHRERRGDEGGLRVGGERAQTERPDAGTAGCGRGPVATAHRDEPFGLDTL